MLCMYNGCCIPDTFILRESVCGVEEALLHIRLREHSGTMKNCMHVNLLSDAKSVGACPFFVTPRCYSHMTSGGQRICGGLLH